MEKALRREREKNVEICNAFFDSIIFSLFNYQRGPANWQDNFFLRVTDDLVDTLIAIELLTKKGLRNQVRRECRFILELAIKAAHINQQNPQSDFASQINAFQKLLKDPSISVVNQLNYPLFNDQQLVNEFNSDVKRMYGILCNFVHATPVQLKEKMELAKSRTEKGQLSIEEYVLINDELRKVLSFAIVLLFNSMPQYVVGDFLEPAPEGYYFLKSKYIVRIDEQFDYKHERQRDLERRKNERKAGIEF